MAQKGLDTQGRGNKIFDWVFGKGACGTIPISDRVTALQRIAEGKFSALPEREKKVLSLRHGLDGDPFTIRATAAHLKIHPSTVKRRQKAAFERLQGKS